MIKKLAITIFLLMLLSSSYALDWRLAGTSNKVNVYIDQDSIKVKEQNTRNYGGRDIDESLVNLWVMFDQLSESNYKSFKAQLMIDCNRDMVSYLYTIMYSGLNGNGDVVKSNTTPSKMAPVIPGSMDSKIFEASCNKKL